MSAAAKVVDFPGRPDPRVDADACIRRFDALATNRASWDSHWREIAERIRPASNQFQRSTTPGTKQTEKVFDATAALALERFGAAFESLLTPRTQTWHKLRPVAQELIGDPAVMRWCDEVTRRLFAVRYAPRANFASQAHECYMDIGAFGSTGMFVEDVPGQMIRYKSLPLAHLYFAENYVGQVDTVFRDITYSTRQVMQQFGEKTPQRIREAMPKEPDRPWRFLHYVCPNTDRKRGRRDHLGMAFMSTYLWYEGREVVDQGGFRTFPFPIGRYATAPNEVYGRSPAMIVLPDIKMLNAMNQTIIRAAQKIVDPPLLLADDGALSAFSLRSGALNYGYLSEGGEPLVRALETKADIQIGIELLEGKRKVINDAFLVTLFQILVENPQMTATEALLRAQEKGQLLAPAIGRQQTEFLGPLIEREIDILSAAGVLPPPPPQLLDAGGQIDVEYSSPLNNLQRAEEGIAIMRTLEAVTPIAQIDPSVLDVFDAEQVARSLADIYGVPAIILRTPEAMAALRQAKAQAAQVQQLLAAAPVAASAAKDLATAQAMGSGSPSNQGALLG